jgi:hypothetical protein
MKLSITEFLYGFSIIEGEVDNDISGLRPRIASLQRQIKKLEAMTFERATNVPAMERAHNANHA